MNVSAFKNAYLNRINTIMQSEEINLRVANALTFVVQTVFANIANSFTFTLSTSGGAEEFWLHDIMRKLFSTWGLIGVQLVILDSKTVHVDVPGIRYCNMILVDSFESLKRTNISEYNRSLDSLEYYYIFLQTHDELLESETKKISRYCFDNYWIHCNIMVQNSKGEILVYTYFPFKENNCFKTQPELINRFVGNKFENEVMFPDKLKNLQGCVLKLSTWETPPFVMNATNKRISNLFVTGFEIFALDTISKKMNFTLDVEWLEVESYHQNTSPEMASLSKLKNLETNFTMSYFRRTSDKDKIGTATFSTYYLPLVAIILRKEASHEFMDIWTFPFDITTWSLISIVYTLIGLLNNFQNMDSKGGIFEIFGAIMGMPVSFLPVWTSTRIRFMTAVISSFVLRSVYQSLLFYMFHSNFYQDPPLTFDSLVEDGYTAVATEATSRFLLYVPQIIDQSLPLMLINNTNEIYPLRYMELYQNGSFVAMSAVEFVIFYVSTEMSSPNALVVLSINVQDQQICLYLTKHSFYIECFNLYIMHFHQAGLFDIWRKWTLYDYKIMEIAATTAYENLLMVNLRQLVGFLFLILFLLLISIVVFALELISKKFKCLQKLF